MGQPAHDGAVLAQHLHAVDAEVIIVLAGVGRAPGDDQRPGDERRRLARPAALDRQLGQVDVITLEHHLLHRRCLDRLRPHAQHCLSQGQHVEGVLEAARRLGLAQEGEKLADLAQFLRGGAVFAVEGDAHGDALDVAEQVDQHRHGRGRAVGERHVLEQHSRTFFGQQAQLDLGHFEVGRDGRCDAHQFAGGFQPGDEVTQGCVGGHGYSCFPCGEGWNRRARQAPHPALKGHLLPVKTAGLSHMALTLLTSPLLRGEGGPKG